MSRRLPDPLNLVTYHLLCPESHFLMREAIVVIRTTLASNIAMAVVGFASGFFQQLLVGLVLPIIFVI